MPLTAGARLGPYEITSPIGAGGMGEVYKAKDTRLDRIVAIKVLPSHLSDHDELRQRFEQEARAVSSLNHPNICTLHDIGRENGVDFIVMEYVEGETLAERLERGPLTWQEAVRYAIELSDALDKAHRAGVVHRDVKPGNIIVTKSGIKLLDFGLAKLHSSGGSEADLSAVTEAKPLTEKGAILGTFQYMSPEQLEGNEADGRSDIFALGAVLYEMVTAEKAFKGASQASLIAAIMSSNPRPIGETQVVSPSRLDRVVSTCLEKDPDARWQSVADLRRNLQWLANDDDIPSAAPAHPSRMRSVMAVAGWIVGIAAATIAFTSLSGGREEPTRYFQIALGVNKGIEPGARAHVAISPDGSRVAFVVRDGINRLFLRRLDEPEAHMVPGSEHAYNPVFSPDGEWIAFQSYPADGQLKKVSIHGGAPQVVASNRLPAGATWLADDTIVFADWPDLQGLYRVPASGGEVETLKAQDPRKAEGVLLYPEALPDGRTLLVTKGSSGSSSIVSISLDTYDESVIVDNATNPRYVSTGHLLFVRSGDLWSVGFDPARQQIIGNERPVLEGVEHRGWSSLDLSKTGVLAYVPGQDGPWLEEALTWISPDGKRTLASTDRKDFEWPRISPDGRKIALYTSDDAFLESQYTIWMVDIESKRSSRVTFDPGVNLEPVWMPDGGAFIFASNRGGGSIDLYRQPVESNEEAELLLASENDLRPQDVSPDGNVLVYLEGDDLRLLDLNDGSVSTFAATSAPELNASFSPDGRFLAYDSRESGRAEIYVQTYPAGRKSQVSQNGGIAPVWAPNGCELYYLRGTTLIAVEITLEPGFQVLAERELFEAAVNRGRSFDVHPTTGEFLVVDKTLESAPQYVNLVTNFFELLKTNPPE